MLITNASTRRWTSEEFIRLGASGFFGPEERVELIEGEIVVMSPPGPEHSNPILYGTDYLMSLYRESHLVAVQLPLDLGSRSQPQPDFALIARGSVPRGQLPQTADLVIEVSVSSLAFDRKEKGAIYAKAGIPEYWIIDVAGRQVEVYREPGPLGYALRRLHAVDDTVCPLKVPGPACELSAFFSPEQE